MNNPFSVVTPENITSDEIKNMFVESTDFKNLEKKGHTFIHGHRGCGKSMALQALRTKHYMKFRNINYINEVPFICMYIPIKRSVLATIELERLKNDVLEKYFAEHMLCLHFAINICKELIDLIEKESLDINEKEIELFTNRIKLLGFEINYSNKDNFIKELFNLFEMQWTKDNLIRRKISLIKNHEEIIEPEIFTSYHDFLLPLIKFLKKLDLNNKLDKDIYLLVDDADNLPTIFTETLNEWILYRDTDSFSFKVSTQLKYKTYRTISNNRIEKPHDYSEIVFSYVVSSQKKRDYYKFIKDIVERRLKTINIDSDAQTFLPEKESQVTEIEKIKENYREAWRKGEGRGNQESDDANRYSRPDYIKMLSSKKQKAHYSYSGFRQLVNISSGIVRHFLEPLSKMYEEQKVKNNGEPIIKIDDNIQNIIIRNESIDFFKEQFEHLEKEVDKNDIHEEKIKKLKNLITVLGENFHEILLSDLSERRVFSFTISDDSNVDKELKEILKLAVEYGFLYESKIGKKSSSGRTELYILARLLAPYFTLDPNGFSGYQSLTTEWLKEALLNSNLKLKKLVQDDNISLKNIQPTLPGL